MSDRRCSELGWARSSEPVSGAEMSVKASDVAAFVGDLQMQAQSSPLRDLQKVSNTNSCALEDIN